MGLTGIFVYGSLKPGYHNHHVALDAGAFTVSEGYIDGFRLFHLEPENYPGVVRGSGRVYGCILRFRDITAALPSLDALELTTATPPEYVRVTAEASAVGTSALETVWLYLYANMRRLAEGRGVYPLPEGRWPDGVDSVTL